MDTVLIFSFPVAVAVLTVCDNPSGRGGPWRRLILVELGLVYNSAVPGSECHLRSQPQISSGDVHASARGRIYVLGPFRGVLV